MDETTKTYNRIAEEYGKTHFDPSFWGKEFQIFNKLIDGKKVIDIGCGAGRDAVLFTQEDFDYTGIDYSKEMLSIARKRAKTGKFILMDFYDLNLPKNSFDGFWAAASILHIPKRKIAKVLQDIRKIIKPNGVGFISIKERKSIGEGIIKEGKYGGIARYFAFYDKKEFQKLLESNGFSVIRSHTLKEGDTNWLCYFVDKV